MKFKRKG